MASTFVVNSFTFLATLLLLLAVSLTIVLRSLIIRRRFQRRVQDALAQGIVLSPTPGSGGSRRFGLGEKPRTWDAWLTPLPKDEPPQWQSLVPVSARILSERVTGAGQPLVQVPPQPNFLQSASSGLVRAHRWRPSFMRRPSGVAAAGAPSAGQSSLQAGASGATSPDNQTVTEEVDAAMQVGVLIAMPSQYRPRAWQRADRARISSESDPERALKGKARSAASSESDLGAAAPVEEDVPDVAVGVAELPWRVRIDRPTNASEQHQSSPGS